MAKRRTVAEWWTGERCPLINVRGRYKMPGYINRGDDNVVELRKKLAREHILQVPPAICIDVDLLNYLQEEKGVRRIVCYFRRHYYAASAQAIRNRNFVIKRGYNRQFALEWAAWWVDGREAGEQQAELPLPAKPKREIELPDYLMR